MTTIKLGRLPDRAPVKLAISVSPRLLKRLAAYADLYHRTYGIEEPVAALIPYMLDAFLSADREFIKNDKGLWE